jgi:SLT domain-containing protein
LPLTQDRLTVLTEEISDLRGEHETRPHGPGTSQEDVSQLISTMEENLVLTEKEHTESEADWSRKLCEKTRETDELKMILQSFAKLQEEKESIGIHLLCYIQRHFRNIAISQLLSQPLVQQNLG